MVATIKRGCMMMNDQNEAVLKHLNALRLNRRRLVGGAAAGALVAPVFRSFPPQAVAAAPLAAIRAQGDPRTLVGLDNLPGQNWLYFDPAKLYEINPASGFQVVYEC